MLINPTQIADNFNQLKEEITIALEDKWNLSIANKVPNYVERSRFAEQLHIHDDKLQDFSEVITEDMEQRFIDTLAALDQYLQMRNPTVPEFSQLDKLALGYASLVLSLQKAIDLLASIAENAVELGLQSNIKTINSACQDIRRIIKRHTSDLVINGRQDPDFLKYGHYHFFVRLVQSSLKSWQAFKFSHRPGSLEIMKAWGIPARIVERP